MRVAGKGSDAGRSDFVRCIMDAEPESLGVVRRLGEEDEASSPQATAVALLNAIASVVKWIQVFFFYPHASFPALFSIPKYGTCPLPSPRKRIEPR